MNFTDYLPMLYDIIGYFKNVPEHINLQSTVATNMFANWSNALILMSFSSFLTVGDFFFLGHDIFTFYQLKQKYD